MKPVYIAQHVEHADMASVTNAASRSIVWRLISPLEDQIKSVLGAILNRRLR